MAESIGRVLLRGGIWAGAGRVVAALAAFLANVLLARLVSPEIFGAYFIALSIVTLLGTIGILGLDQAAVRLVAETVARGRPELLGALVTRLLVGAGIGAAVVTLLFLLSRRAVLLDLFDSPLLVDQALVIGIWILVSIPQVALAAIFRGLQDIRLATLFGGLRTSGILLNLLFLLGLLVFWLKGISSLTAVLALAVGATVILGLAAWGVLGAILSRLEGGARETVKGPAAAGVDPSTAPRAILLIAWPLMVASLMVAARTSGDVLLIGGLSTVPQVALYGAAKRLQALLVAPLLVIAAVLGPLIADLHAKGDRKSLEQAVRVSATVAGLPAVSIFVLLLLLGRWVLALSFGEFYAAGYPILVILLAGQLVNVLAGPNGLALAMAGQQRMVMAGMALSAGVVLGVGWLLAPAHGAIGVAYAATLGLLVQNLFMTWVVRRRLGIWTHVVLSPRRLREGVRLLASSGTK